MGEHCFPYPKFKLMQEIRNKKGEEIEVEWGELKGTGALTQHLLVNLKYD